jgi:hypothetical protein
VDFTYCAQAPADAVWAQGHALRRNEIAHRLRASGEWLKSLRTAPIGKFLHVRVVATQCRGCIRPFKALEFLSPIVFYSHNTQLMSYLRKIGNTDSIK